MGTNKKSVMRWPFVVGYLGIIATMLACMAVGVGSTSTESGDGPDVQVGTVQIDNGVVTVVNESGSSVPVAGTSTFELVAPLEATVPWTVAGRVIATNESTQIEDGLQVGDVVRVRGTILDDGTWLAYSIESAEEQVDPIIILIGKVDSVDPWVVNGITLSVTAETLITGEIIPGTLVRVEILLLEDGTWQVLSIAPIGDITEVPECATVIATVVAVNGNQVQFLGWPSITLGEDVVIEGSEAEGEPGGVLLNPDEDVIVVVCPSEEGQIVIVQIIIINIVINPPGDDVGTPGDGEKVLVCHKPDKKKGGNTLSISSSAVPAHLGHGDFLGPCP